MGAHVKELNGQRATCLCAVVAGKHTARCLLVRLCALRKPVPTVKKI